MRVSIVVLNYNYERYVELAIQSALAQTHDDVEVIVVDDGSTDGSRAVIERFRHRVRAVFKENAGQASAYNAGFELVTGDIVLFLDADDTLDPDACAEVVRAFAPPVVKVHFKLRVVDGEGRATGAIVPRELVSGDVYRTFLKRGQLYPSPPASGNAFLVRALRRIMPLPLDPRDYFGADFFTIHGITALGEVRTVGSTPLGSYRVHRPGAAQSLALGNCAQTPEPDATYGRYSRLRAWLEERLGRDLGLPSEVRDFSLEKLRFATVLTGSAPYIKRVASGVPVLCTRIFPSIYHHPGSVLARAGLCGWAIAVVVLPSNLGMPLLRYVCNPLAR